MTTFKYLPDEFENCGIIGEWPIEILATINTHGGCPDTRATVDIWSVTVVVQVYGPKRIDITKRIITSKTDLIYWEERVLKAYLESVGAHEESA